MAERKGGGGMNQEELAKYRVLAEQNRRLRAGS